MPAPLKIGAIYVRVSTGRQDEHELSPYSQIKLAQDYAKKNQIHVPEEYIFHEKGGVSGKRADKRPYFQRMIALAKSADHPFDVILVWKYSHFARNQEESIVYKTMLQFLYQNDCPGSFKNRGIVFYYFIKMEVSI